jgi:hypothetical protein
MNTRYIHPPYSPSFALSFCPPPRTGTHSWKRPVLPSCLSFFEKKKVCTDSPRGLYMGTSGLYILCFNQINHSITYSFSITVLP